MANESRVQKLLDEILDAGRAPEEVCRDCSRAAAGGPPPLAADAPGRGGTRCAVPGGGACLRLGRQIGAGRYQSRGGPAFAGRSPNDRPLPGLSGGSARGASGASTSPGTILSTGTWPSKSPSPERVSGPDDVEQYQREARALAQLDHPRIVPVHDVGRHRGTASATSSPGTSRGTTWPNGRDRAGGRSANRRASGRWSQRRLHSCPHPGHGPPRYQAGQHPDRSSGQPWVADFGLAAGAGSRTTGKEVQFRRHARVHEPEPARGEGHTG